VILGDYPGEAIKVFKEENSFYEIHSFNNILTKVMFYGDKTYLHVIVREIQKTIRRMKLITGTEKTFEDMNVYYVSTRGDCTSIATDNTEFRINQGRMNKFAMPENGLMWYLDNEHLRIKIKFVPNAKDREDEGSQIRSLSLCLPKHLNRSEQMKDEKITSYWDEGRALPYEKFGPYLKTVLTSNNVLHKNFLRRNILMRFAAISITDLELLEVEPGQIKVLAENIKKEGKPVAENELTYADVSEPGVEQDPETEIVLEVVNSVHTNYTFEEFLEMEYQEDMAEFDNEDFDALSDISGTEVEVDDFDFTDYNDVNLSEIDLPEKVFNAYKSKKEKLIYFIRRNIVHHPFLNELFTKHYGILSKFYTSVHKIHAYDPVEEMLLRIIGNEEREEYKANFDSIPDNVEL